MFRRLRNEMRYCAISVSIAMLGALLIATALGLAVAGLYLWLVTLLPDYVAVLVVAAGIFLVGVVSVSAAILRKRPPEPTQEAAVTTPLVDAEFIMQDLLQGPLTAAVKSPIPAVLAAIALGLIVGVARPKKSP